MYPTKKLWEICEILDKFRKPVTSSDRKKWIYPYYWATWIQDFVDSYIFDDELVLIWEDWAKWWSWCKTAFKISGKTWVNNHAHVLKTKSGILLDNWLIYFINFSNLEWYITWATVKKLNQEKLKQIPIPLPPFPTQQKIVSKLDSLFEKLDQAITLTKQNLANIEEFNKSILEKIFKECEEKYENRKLREIIILNYWKSAEKNENWLYDVYWANWVMYKSDKFLFDWESIIVWRKWSAGALNKVNWRFWASDVTYFVVTNENINYIFNWLKFLNISSLAKWVKPWINRNDVYDLFLPLPPLSEQQKIVEYLDNIFAENQKLKNLYQAQINNLDEMKQSFLKKAFAGELV